MKKVFQGFVNLALLFALCVPAFSQPSSKSVETFVIDNFDTEQEWTWNVNASRFIAEGYPKYGYFDGMPNSLKPLRRDGDPDPKVFGVQVAYNRKGDNWFEVYPAQDGEPYEVPLIGSVDHFDFWVWGANYLYFLEVLVRDANGRVHVLPAGNLAFNGWKNVVVSIPGWLTQHSRLRSGPETMFFVGFRIRSDSSEFVDDFTIYFDNIKYISNSLSFIYDGYELRDTDFGSAETGSSASSGSSSNSSESSDSEAK